jgi:hypothetical protein
VIAESTGPMSSRSEHNFDLVEVIESTKDSIQPVKELIDRVLARFKRESPGVAFDSRHHEPQSRIEFFDLLDGIAADYRRERVIIRAGYLVVRFTGSEAINHPGQVWRELFATIAVWERQSRSA